MMENLNTLVANVKEVAKKITGSQKRRIAAMLAIQFCGGSPRKTERRFGFSRDCVITGVGELLSGVKCLDDYSSRGRIKTEVVHPEMEEDIHEILKEHTQTDPTFHSSLRYSKMTAAAVRDNLITTKAYSAEVIPSRQTIGAILNRQGYRLRKVLKSKPIKKIKETDMIFNNVRRQNAIADDDHRVLRISIDCKAKVKIGKLSRNGKSRGKYPVKAEDHDTEILTKLVPFGISVVNEAKLDVFFGHSHETSDFIVDCLLKWWDTNQVEYENIEELVINLDNGPSVNSHRTQFIKRMVEFTHSIEKTVKLIYYPPYHSKYNPVEHCWGVLENYWNGAILESVEVALKWAGAMKWRNEHPTIHDMPGEYSKGVKLTKKELTPYYPSFHRLPELPKWHITITP